LCSISLCNEPDHHVSGAPCRMIVYKCTAAFLETVLMHVANCVVTSPG